MTHKTYNFRFQQSQTGTSVLFPIFQKKSKKALPTDGFYEIILSEYSTLAELDVLAVERAACVS